MEGNTSEEVQVNLPLDEEEEPKLRLRPLEPVRLQRLVPAEISMYGKRNTLRNWILQDGRENSDKGTENRSKYTVPKKPRQPEGIRKKMLTDFFWEQMLDEVLQEVGAAAHDVNYCSEYDSNYVKDNFEPRDLAKATDKNVHLKFPLYGTGSSAITYYSETVHKIGPGEILEKFRRCQDFTKPMGERFDKGWVL